MQITKHFVALILEKILICRRYRNIVSFYLCQSSFLSFPLFYWPVRVRAKPELPYLGEVAVPNWPARPTVLKPPLSRRQDPACPSRSSASASTTPRRLLGAWGTLVTTQARGGTRRVYPPGSQPATLISSERGRQRKHGRRRSREKEHEIVPNRITYPLDQVFVPCLWTPHPKRTTDFSMARRGPRRRLSDRSGLHGSRSRRRRQAVEAPWRVLPGDPPSLPSSASRPTMVSSLVARRGHRTRWTSGRYIPAREAVHRRQNGSSTIQVVNLVNSILVILLFPLFH